MSFNDRLRLLLGIMEVNRRRFELVTKPEWFPRFAGKCFVCKVCGENFKNEGVAKAHLRSSHTLNEKQFLCRKCGAIFKTEKECRTHLQREHLKAMKLLETQTNSPSVKKGLDLIDSPALRCGHKNILLLVLQVRFQQTHSRTVSWDLCA